MVGPVHPEVQTIAHEIPGIVWIGFVPYLELPRYLSSFDVCILPQEVSELRHNANPLKVWEYFATGKPFVSVALRILDPFREIVDVAQSREQFLELVERRLQGESVERAEMRKSLAINNSWDALFNKMMESLSNNI
jgi:hypothetical protein